MKLLCLLICCGLLLGCDDSSNRNKKKYVWNTLEVTATAYNSTKWQTDQNPHVGAFGDSLKPGMNYIAVSRDLYRQGMVLDTPVRIEGLNGLYLVKDRMPSRWKKRIDIYMGTNIDSARHWGRRQVKIHYRVEVKDSIE